MRTMRYLLLIAAATMMSIGTATAADLVMFRQDGCPWCAAWDREIKPIYGKTDIGRRVPLQMANIHRDRSKFMLKRKVIYTPTFVLIEEGREVGRIEGYAGDLFFWGLLERLLEQLPSGTVSGLSATPQIH